jgi:hypothetical protein
MLVAVALVYAVVANPNHPQRRADPPGINHDGAQNSDHRLALARACERGSTNKCVDAATAYLADNDEQSKDAKYGLSLLMRGCEGRDGLACAMLSGRHGAKESHWHNLKKADHYLQRAIRIYEAGCSQNAADSCAGLADLLRSRSPRGKGPEEVSQIEMKARRLLEQACDREGAGYCRRLADFCHEREDDGCYVSALRRACSVGHTDSCCVLGIFLRDVVRDPEGPAYMRKGCEGGDRSCCTDSAAGLVRHH